MAVACGFHPSQCLPVRWRSQGAQEERKGEAREPSFAHLSISPLPSPLTLSLTIKVSSHFPLECPWIRVTVGVSGMKRRSQLWDP